MDDILDSEHAGPAAVRGGVLRIAGYVVGVLLTVVSAAFLFRQLGVEDGGRYVLVLSTVTLAAGVTDAGLSSIGVRELSLEKGPGRVELMRTLLGLRIAFTLAGIAGAVIYAALAGLGDRLILGTLIAGFGIMLTNLQSAYATALMADLRLGWVTILDLLRQAATAVLIVVLAVAGAELLPFFAVAPAAAFLALLLTARIVRGNIPLTPSFDRERWVALLRQTLPFALATAVGSLYLRLAILMVDQLSTPRETGLFGVSFRVVEVLIIVPQLTIGAALPIFSRAARDDHERLEYGLGLAGEAMVMLGAAVALALAAGAPIVIDVVAGSGFAEAEDVMRLHGVALLLSFAAAPWGFGLVSLRRHTEMLVCAAVATAVLLVGLFLLVPDHGAIGGAWATIAGEAALALTGAFLVRRAGIPLRMGRLPRITVAAGLAVAPAVLLPPLAAVPAALLVYVGVLLALRAIPAELLEAVRR